jgi:hypothetical protein
MSIKTSNFFSYNGRIDEAVSIARSAPYGFLGDRFEALMPSWDLLNAYKRGVVNDAGYSVVFKAQLAKLDAHEVYAALDGKTLLCWEHVPKFCHRHLVAQWLRSELGVRVVEL